MRYKKIIWFILLFIALLSTSASAEEPELSPKHLQFITSEVLGLCKSAETYKAQGDYNGTVKSYSDALIIIEDTEKALTNNNNNMVSNRYEYLSFINNQKNNLYFKIGHAYYLEKDYKKALEAFETVEEMVNPKRNYPLELSEAYDVTKKISSNDASNYYLYYAECNEALGNKDKAHMYYTEANKYFKVYPDELFLKAKEAFIKNDFSRSVELFKDSLNKRPENMEAYLYIAKSYLALNDKQQAESITDFIIAKNMTDLNSIYAFKSVIQQSKLDYKAASLTEKNIKKGFKRNLLLILSVLILMTYGAAAYYTTRGKKLKYSDSLDELYGEIETLRTDKTLSNETKSDTTGFEF